MVKLIKKLKEPDNTAFKQQNIRSCRLKFKPVPTIIFFLILGTVLVALGIVLYTEAQSVKEYKFRYDDICSKYKICYIKFPVMSLKAPFYIYYQLENFYQNNKKYYSSRNAKQLRGDMIYSYSELRECGPYISRNGSLDINDFYIPCGLMARKLNRSNIAHSSEVGVLYKNPPSDQPGIRVIDDFENEDFVVWMHGAALPFFRKLWATSYLDMDGIYYGCIVTNNFNVSAFNGRKYIVMVEKNWLGSSSRFLGILYISTGVFYLLIGFIFLIAYIWSKRRNKISAARKVNKKSNDN